MHKPELFHETNQATYCPEDDKLRLYVGRVPNDEYRALRNEGWTSTPKQSEAGQGEFAAVWTPEREDTALSYAGEILDEDTPPQERAADRAERFGGYRDNNLGRADTAADNFAAGPQVHGFQSYARAVRAADRHDRHAGRAVCMWDRAEYWQRRTCGVIRSSLYKSRPDVRMGRIKTIEAELRRVEKSEKEYLDRFRGWQSVAGEPDEMKALRRAYRLLCDAHYSREYTHPRTGKNGDLYDLMRARFMKDSTPEELADALTPQEAAALWLEGRLDPESEAYQETSGGSRAIRHYKLRLAYENQMLEAQGGRAATVEMEVGGWLGSYQIHKVNKSTASGRVVSVAVLARTHGRDRWGNEDPKAPEFRLEVVNVERLKPDAYTPPTAEEKAAFLARVKADKKAAKATAPPPIPLINPTLEDARRLQDMINQRHAAEWERHHGKPSASYGPKAREVEVITQAVYSANSGGTYSKAETRGLCADGQLEDPPSNMWSSAREARRKARGPVLCKIRIAGSDPVRVLVLSDKPQKALPAGVWLPVQAPEPQPITV